MPKAVCGIKFNLRSALSAGCVEDEEEASGLLTTSISHNANGAMPCSLQKLNLPSAVRAIGTPQQPPPQPPRKDGTPQRRNACCWVLCACCVVLLLATAATFGAVVSLRRSAAPGADGRARGAAATRTAARPPLPLKARASSRAPLLPPPAEEVGSGATRRVIE